LSGSDHIKDVGQKVHDDAQLQPLVLVAVQDGREHGRQYARGDGKVEDVVVDVNILSPQVVVQDRHQVAVAAQNLPEEAAEKADEPGVARALIAVVWVVGHGFQYTIADERTVDGKDYHDQHPENGGPDEILDDCGCSRASAKTRHYVLAGQTRVEEENSGGKKKAISAHSLVKYID
jgi:hypothetical protein